MAFLPFYGFQNNKVSVKDSQTADTFNCEYQLFTDVSVLCIEFLIIGMKLRRT